VAGGTLDSTACTGGADPARNALEYTAPGIAGIRRTARRAVAGQYDRDVRGASLETM